MRQPHTYIWRNHLYCSPEEAKLHQGGRQGRGRSLPSPDAASPNCQTTNNIKKKKKWNVRGGIMETVKQCSARLNRPWRCAALKVSRCREGEHRKTSPLVDWLAQRGRHNEKRMLPLHDKNCGQSIVWASGRRNRENIVFWGWRLRALLGLYELPWSTERQARRVGRGTDRHGAHSLAGA